MRPIAALALTWLTLTWLTLALTGCGRDSTRPAQQGVNITAPGVNIQTDSSGNVKVQAPGVGVNAGTQGTGAQTPGVNVNIKNQ